MRLIVPAALCGLAACTALPPAPPATAGSRLKTRKNKPTNKLCNSTAAASTTKPCNSCASPNAAAAAAAPNKTPSSC